MSASLLGFIPDPLTVPFEKLLPSRRLPMGLEVSKKYLQIKSSIGSIGLIEPLTIGAVDKATGAHVLRDGHIRVQAMKELGFHDAPCLVAIDDESYTYNNRVNRLSTIQEHMMIRRAVERGVTPERIAKDLKVDVSHIQKKLNLLDGICAEAAGLLKDQRFSPNIGGVIRKMKPTRQIECVELMVATNNVTVSYANALLAATPVAMLVGERKPKKLAGVSAEQMAKMEKEMGNLQGQYKSIEHSYGQDVLNLVLAKGYLKNLLDNEAVFRFLSMRQPDVLREFSNLVEVDALDK
ncbi:plasmid partitioning protein RepB C-terminal domain-containing protein [Rhizobacter sp. Root16D2]|uniref:plasmid partitioning protein RepB C-terminal domain-containing protein n=1 Tax=Rhizobacter sp. Root16D2 TaxID=1736479 RepID=UPI0006F58D4C|nr:plasmid partitioning protein RepB C-terminal domain-containing protein [Rhizobacter sp. Root16D2]KRB25428.1 chromosome partitioning protein ParB [Rhizobacter sp. Root16D2]